MMEIDPKEIVETAKSGSEARESRAAALNAAVAITVAVLATFMGICKVKDDNIVQAMQQAQADKLDHWAYYQARNLRQEVAEATATQLALTLQGTKPANPEAYGAAIDKYRALAQDQGRKKEEMRAAAENDQKAYDALNYRDDQFDLSDALLAIAIAMLAVTALTRLWPLFYVSLVPTTFGSMMGVAGLAAWPIHPDVLIKLLS